MFYCIDINEFINRSVSPMHISNFLSHSRKQSIGLAYCSLEELADVEENYLGKMDKICEFCRNFMESPLRKIQRCTLQMKLFPRSAVVTGNKILNPLGRVPLLEKIICSDKTRPNYLDNIREINNALAFASIGVRIEMPAGKGPRVFRIHGDIYHQIGALDPPDNIAPTYASLYIIDPKKALDFRKAREENADIDGELLEKLQRFLTEVSPYAKAFRHLHQVEQKEQQ